MKLVQRAVLPAIAAMLAAGWSFASDGNTNPPPRSAAHAPVPPPAAPPANAAAPASAPAHPQSPAPASPEKPPSAAPAAPALSRPAFYEKYLTDDLPLDREIRVLQKKCADNPKDAGAHNDLGNLLALRGFPKEAHASYREAEKLDSGLYIANYNDGLLYEKEGKIERAKDAFRRTIRKKPGLPEAHFHLALIYEGEGRTEQAISQYSEALRIDDRLRDPAFNALSVQSRLIYRASIANYKHDISTAGLQVSGEYADASVRRALSPEKPIFADSASNADSDDEEEAEAPPTGPKTVTLMNNAASTPSARGNQNSTQPGNQQTSPNARPGSPDYRRQTPPNRRYTPPRRTPPQSVPVPAPPTISAPPPPPPDSPEESNDQEPPPNLSF
jgi:hypothetical protein